MPHIKLTQDRAEKLQPKPAEVIYWAEKSPGFGLRVSPKGTKTFIVQYRVRQPDGTLKERQEKLGRLEYMTVAQARKRAQQSQSDAIDGIDPVAERRAKKKAEAEAEAEKRKAKKFTFDWLVDRYQQLYADINTKKSSANETRRRLKRWSVALGKRPITDIRKADILSFLNELRMGKANGSGLIEANNLLAAVYGVFEWARKHDLVEINPAHGVAKPMRNVPTRDRWFNDDEIAAFWTACEQVGWPSGRIFQLLLLTGQREGEVAGMRWAELDVANRVWNLPATRTKNSKAHTVHLSDLAVEIIQALPQINRSQLVFAMNGDKPFVNFWHANQRVHHLMGDSVPHWTPHDLRRTATSVMARIGIPPHVADRVLNHQSGTISGVAAIYNRFEYLDERKAALEALGRFIEQLIGRDTDNVVPLRQPA